MVLVTVSATAAAAAASTSLEEEREQQDVVVDYHLDLDYCYKNYNDCVPCPKLGSRTTTTLRVGSTTASCQVVTPEDLLGMIYDLASGEQ